MSVPGIVSKNYSYITEVCFGFNLIKRCDDHRRRWDLREYEKKASDRIENLRSIKKKTNTNDDSDDDDDQKRKSDEKRIARTLLQAREFKVCQITFLLTSYLSICHIFEG